MGEEQGKWKVGEILAEVWNLGPSGSALSPIQIGRIYRYNTDIVVPLHATVMGVDELFQRPGGVSAIEVLPGTHLRPMRIVLGDEVAPRHLILMGRNGAGKTTLLRSLRDRLTQSHDDWDAPNRNLRPPYACGFMFHSVSAGIRLEFSDEVIRFRVVSGSGLLAYFSVQRGFIAGPVEGPKKQDVSQIGSPGQPGPMMMQHLVNERFEELLAREDGKEAEANRIRAWVERVERSFQKLTDSPSLRLVFERKPMSYAYALQMGERRIGLDQLPDGWSSLLAIVSELMIRQISMPGYGIVLIDEIDAHLHPELQRKVLGILTELFPTLQFIVTTHSPLVLTSAKNTQIYDLDDDETYDVEELRGKSFRSLLRAPFGLATDVDIDTEEKWSRWHTLFRMPSRSPSEQAELEQLDDVLSGRSALLRERMWHIKNIGEEEEGEE